MTPRPGAKQQSGQRSLLLVNISQLPQYMGSWPARGKDMREVEILENAAIFIADGKITGMGEMETVLGHPVVEEAAPNAEVIDCGGRVALPGLVDSHTHPVFAGPRLVDFEKRIQGASYEQIAEAGGGIRASVNGVRKASTEQLAAKALSAFEAMAAHGTTTVEAKSGYGLSSAAELKSLEAIAQAAAKWKGTVVATLLGAHVVPAEFAESRGKYLDEICQKMIPQAARRKLASYVDVFVEQGAFTLNEAERIFEAATSHKLGVRAHVCQLSQGSIQPLLRFEPASLDHMDHCAATELKALAKTDTVATLAPGSNYFLGKPYPDARRLIEANVPVALATDYNPGTSPMLSMQMVMSLACTQMKMSPMEALVAATVNPACSLGLKREKGCIEPMRDADVAVFDCDDVREIPYWFGSNRCWMTVVGGAVEK